MKFLKYHCEDTVGEITLDHVPRTIKNKRQNPLWLMDVGLLLAYLEEGEKESNSPAKRDPENNQVSSVSFKWKIQLSSFCLLV